MRLIHAAGALALALALAMLVAGCGGGGSGSSGGEGEVPVKKTNFTGSGSPGVDAANTRAVGGPIDSSSVGRLQQAWTLKLSGQSTYGSYASTPIVADGVVYSQDLASNVQAIDLQTGEVL